MSSITSTRKTQNVFAHSPSLQILWKCAGQRRLLTKTLINSAKFKNIYKDVLQYVNSKSSRRRSPLALILDSHLMLGLVYVYSKTVILWHQDVEKLYKDAVVHRSFEFDDPTKLKLTRKKETILTGTQWQIDIDENLLPDERMLLERDFPIEIPRQLTPPEPIQSPDNLPPLPWEVLKPTHGKRMTLLLEVEVRNYFHRKVTTKLFLKELIPKFDIIDDRFSEPLPVPPTTAMDIDERYDRTFFHAASEDRSKELLRAPRVDRHLDAPNRYVHPSQDRTMDEQHPPRTVSSDLPPLPMPPMDTTSTVPDRFSIDALAFIKNAIDTYPIYGSTPRKTVLLGVDCLPSSNVPLIFVQEPTVIGADELAMPMDTLPPLDQVAARLFGVLLVFKMERKMVILVSNKAGVTFFDTPYLIKLYLTKKKEKNDPPSLIKTEMTDYLPRTVTVNLEKEIDPALADNEILFHLTAQLDDVMHGNRKLTGQKMPFKRSNLNRLLVLNMSEQIIENNPN